MSRGEGISWGGWVSAKGRNHSNEAALSLRSRRNGTKFANPASCGFAY